MKRFNFSYLIGVLAILIIGFYSVDLYSDKAGVATLPDFTTEADVEPAEDKPIRNLKDFNDAVVEIADEAIPAVVTIRVTQRVEVRDPFSMFFGNPGNGTREQLRRGLGSGVIVSENGYILTNNHVVEGADEIVVSTHKGLEYDGKVVGTDPRTDIAVVKIDTEENFKALKIGNSDETRVGEMVLAIGSPLNEDLAHSVTMGIISAVDRSIGILGESGGYERFLQTDAAINQGNSGGALINMNGELIGINSAIASRSGGNEGIGFAVPSNLAKSIMESLIETGKVERGYLGISYGGVVDRTMAKALGLEKAQGVIIGSVEANTPAEESGLKEGDVIQTVNGERVDSWVKFRSVIGTSKPGTEITLGINRNGEEQEITVTLGTLPEELASSSFGQQPDRDIESRLGFQVRNLTPNIARQLQIDPNQSGVVVTEISQGSNAYRQGLRQGDVIISVSRNPVEDISDFNSEMSKVAESEDQVALLGILREGAKQLIAFEL